VDRIAHQRKLICYHQKEKRSGHAKATGIHFTMLLLDFGTMKLVYLTVTYKANLIKSQRGSRKVSSKLIQVVYQK
jgi:hypothetical protein